MKTCLFGGFTALLARLGPAGCAAWAKEFGFDAVEPSPCPALSSPEEALRLREALEARGLRAACLSLCVDISGEDAGEAMDTLRRHIDIAAALGSPYLHHTLMPDIRPEAAAAAQADFAREFDRVVRRAQEICDLAGERGVACLYEDQGFVFNGCGPYGQFLEALERDNAGVCLDLGNIYFVSETPQAFAARFAGRVRHVHVKDYYYKPGGGPHPGEAWLPTREGNWLRDTVIGRGVADCEAVFRILHRAGYDGYFSTEFSGPGPFEEGLREGLDHMRRAFAAAQGE